METNYDYAEEIEYITKRAAEEGSVSRYLEETYENKHEMSELVSRIVTLNEQFIEKMDDERLDYTNDDEHEYIAGSTGYSKEIIELVLWFSECYQMMNGNIIYCAKCQKCGNDELYIREEKGGLFCSFVECGKCGETYTYDQMWEYDDNTIPFREEEIPLRNVNEITTSYVFKAATGYRKGIWRTIQISAAATLDDLSNAILSAFDFDDDHLYAFYMDPKGRQYNVPTFYSPRFGYKTSMADRQLLESFGFAPGTKFLYLYDFGDEWHFTITFVKKVEEITPIAFVLRTRGEAPIQYPDDEDDDDEEEFF